MNVLIIGNGAREHALAWKLRQSSLLTDLFVAPGNAGTAALAQNVEISPLDFEAIARLVDERRIELVVVGPEEPLAKGLVDYLAARDIPAYGPTAAAAQLEASKWFAKEVMGAAGIATAEARAFDDEVAAFAYAEEIADRTGLPPVVKADGLAAGKGVVVAASLEESHAAIRATLGGAFGASGRTLLLEERLSGPEVSAHAFCDGQTALPMVYARDHKRLLDGNAGPNTGGMGAYSPPSLMDAALADQIRRTVIEPTLRAMAARGAPYAGTLYPGLMLTAGGPQVIEYNCRFGDPETQILMLRLASDLLPVLLACVERRLAGVELCWRAEVAVGVVLTSAGYPGEYRTGLPIQGLDDVDADVRVFHAGTRLESGRVVTAGGRVLTVVATSATLAAARARVYENVARLQFEGMQYRTDIGWEEPG